MPICTCSSGRPERKLNIFDHMSVALYSLLFSHATMPRGITLLALLGACFASGQSSGQSLSQSYIIRKQDVIENHSVPFSTHFMCSIHSQIMGYTTYWVNDTTGACSMGELTSFWQQDLSGIRVFVETQVFNGKNLLIAHEINQG